MATGLIALLDDIVGITKIAAASVDDIGAAAGRAGAKAAGVVIDDTAVTPRFVVGFTPDRELPIIGRIALGSLRNKLLILLPVALLLSAFAPWAITPLLMLGGAYLCYEGAEKLWEALSGHGGHEEQGAVAALDSRTLERQRISGAIRTDFILSAEIMAIALATVADQSFWPRAFSLAVVAILITIGVYGFVALIVKMDDIGLYLARKGDGLRRTIGRALVAVMPVLMKILSVVGIAAMVWVGGGIIVHGLEGFHIEQPGHMIADAADIVAEAAGPLGGLLGWLVGAIGSGLVGLAIGGFVVVITLGIGALRGPRPSPRP